jgi:hypothetical protein
MLLKSDAPKRKPVIGILIWALQNYLYKLVGWGRFYFTGGSHIRDMSLLPAVARLHLPLITYELLGLVIERSSNIVSLIE